MTATPLLLPHQQNHQLEQSLKRAQKKVVAQNKATKATEDKIVGQRRFTVVSSPNVVAIQAERNKKRADDMKAERCKIQAKVDEDAREKSATTLKETVDTALA